MKHNTHAFSKTHTLNKESQQSGLLTNFQNIVNVANEDFVNDDQTFVGLPTNFQKAENTNQCGSWFTLAIHQRFQFSSSHPSFQ
jgi:hypothetical protein